MTGLQQQLFALQDETYREFHSKLMPDINKEAVIGIRIPVLRRFAGEFAKKPEAREFCSSFHISIMRKTIFT